MSWSSGDGDELAVLERPCLLLEELAGRSWSDPTPPQGSVVPPGLDQVEHQAGAERPMPARRLAEQAHALLAQPPVDQDRPLDARPLVSPLPAATR